MFNLDESFGLRGYYDSHEDFLFKIGATIFGIFSLIELLRSQISEVSLVQLIPGFYFLFLFFTFFLFSGFICRFFHNFRQYDNSREVGIKMKTKIQSKFLEKVSVGLLSIFLFLVFNSVIPISFDCFTDYSLKTVENAWSFTEVVNLELILIIILSLLSQSPLYASKLFLIEKVSNLLPKNWKQILFFLIVFAGSLTPTIDGNTQVTFATCTITLFNFLLNKVQKRNESKPKDLYGF